ncbi:MAG: hypothetical protein BroJett011_42520 [Chloroflexota bacterium]|nr:MAG: hypothetical protein BroJett011_42520 [Chloroflexota bacterium]
MESQGRDIFEPAKELAKLCQDVPARPGTDALLLTYWPTAQFFDFAGQVICFWQQELKGSEARLYLLIVGYENKKGWKSSVIFTHTFQISSEEVIIEPQKLVNNFIY